MASNVFAHTDQIDEITQTVKKILKDKGLFIVEIQISFKYFKRSYDLIIYIMSMLIIGVYIA